MLVSGTRTFEAFRSSERRLKIEKIDIYFKTEKFQSQEPLEEC